MYWRLSLFLFLRMSHTLNHTLPTQTKPSREWSLKERRKLSSSFKLGHLLRLSSSSSSLGIGVKCRNRSVKSFERKGKKEENAKMDFEGKRGRTIVAIARHILRRERERNVFLVSKPNTPICPIDVRRRVIGSQSGATSIGYTWMSIANNRSPRRYWRCSNTSVHGGKWLGWILNRRCAKPLTQIVDFQSINT